jgi:cbb3-type cytochrome oxidase maturation protein
MNVLVYLVPLAIGLGLTGLFAFLWAMRTGQFDDPQGAARRILSDDDIQGASEEVASRCVGTVPWAGCC